ncbi:MAG: alpha/beta hydrolase [Planctomycetota bacterium]
MTNVVLIHGMWHSGNALSPIAEYMSGYSCVIESPTLPDHYRNNQENRYIAGHSLSNYRDFILNQPLLGDQTILIGHGLGGLVAQLVAATTPVKAVILVGSFGPRGVNHLTPGTVSRNFSRLMSFVYCNRAHRPSWLDAQFSLFNNMNQETARWYYDRMCYESGCAFGESMLWQLDPERSSEVPRDQITCPMLILAGGQDKLVPPSSSAQIADYYPNSEYQLFPRLGHMMFAEPDNEQLFRSIGDFIKSHKLITKAQAAEEAPAMPV